MRVPRSARTLEAQVSQRYKKAKAAPHGEADGLGVYRSVQFGRNESKWLSVVLPEIDDPRITDVSEDDGHVVVTFTHTSAADRRAPFPLDEADTVVSARE